MVQEERNDGADEQMLGAQENDNLTPKRDEVKFTKGDQQNGDAKIDIGDVNGKAFTGMSKEELMKYANDPFWVRLRWAFFVAFWLIWLAMLVAAIFIILDAPKCSAPKPLSWFNSGPLLKLNALESNPDDYEKAKKLQASAVIYELPAALTYSLIGNAELNEQIKTVVEQYKDTDVNVVMDITPNYVSQDSVLFKDALADETKRSAFIWVEKSEVPNNWLSIVNGSAWAEVQNGQYVLSQFGDGLYDLHMADPTVKRAFEQVLTHLHQIGVKGFRLKNSKFYLISKNIEDETPSADPNNFVHTQYGFWTHGQTTFQEGLGDLLAEFRATVKATNEAGYLSVAEDVMRPEVYRTSEDNFSIDTPQYGRFIKLLSSNNTNGLQLRQELLNVFNQAGNDTWLQWNLAELDEGGVVDPSAYVLFLSLLPGMQVIAADSALAANISEATNKQVHYLRTSPSFMHGEFDLLDDGQLIAYSRIKSGNPGYFVAYNPTNKLVKAEFNSSNYPERMTVFATSANYNVTGISVKSIVMFNNLEVSPYSTIILTYVPVKSG